MPRGGKRPGAGAPKGNTNALRYGRYSRQYPDAAFYVAMLPDLRRELDLAFSQSPAAANRRLREFIEAAQHVIEITPDLAEKLEVAVFLRRQRLVLVDRGGLFFDLLIVKMKADRLRNALRLASWLIKRDQVFAEVLTGILLPPVRAALAAPEVAQKPARKSIKQSNQPQIESEIAPLVD